MRVDEICLQVPKVETSADAFWVNWLSDLEDIQKSIFAFCVVKNFRGDPRDLLHDVMLIALDKWPEFQRTRASFKTWVLWIARARLFQLYRTERLPVPGARQNAKDGKYIGAVTGSTLLSLEQETEDGALLSETVPDDGIEIELAIIYKEEALIIGTYIKSLGTKTVKGRVLRAMADLIDRGQKPSTRKIARLVGCSHTKVASVLGEIRKDLEEQLNETQKH